MMNKQALGLIETVGMAAAVEAADTCIKSANVELIGYELSKGGGLVTVKIQGDVGAVKSAVDAAKISGGKVNKVFATLIIPRPSQGIASIVESDETVGILSKNGEDGIEINDNHSTDSSAAPSEQDTQTHEFEVNEEENHGKENEEEKEDEKELEKNKSEICNLCKDIKCPRIKGQPKNMCIHYKPKKA